MSDSPQRAQRAAEPKRRRSRDLTDAEIEAAQRRIEARQRGRYTAGESVALLLSGGPAIILLPVGAIGAIDWTEPWGPVPGLLALAAGGILLAAHLLVYILIELRRLRGELRQRAEPHGP